MNIFSYTWQIFFFECDMFQFFNIELKMVYFILQKVVLFEYGIRRITFLIAQKVIDQGSTLFSRGPLYHSYMLSFFIQQITDDINYTTWCVLVTVANIHIKLKTDLKKIRIFSIHCVSVAVFILKYDFFRPWLVSDYYYFHVSFQQREFPKFFTFRARDGVSGFFSGLNRFCSCRIN